MWQGCVIPRRLLRVALLAAVLPFAPSGTTAFSQYDSAPATPTQDINASRTTQPRLFDVVSIRPDHDGKGGGSGVLLNEYAALDEPLIATIHFAYFPVAFFSRNLVIGAPSWVLNESYDFIGKVAPSDLTDWQEARKLSGMNTPNAMLQSMLQAALKERCKLAAHQVPREVVGYQLMVAKHGPKLEEFKEGTSGRHHSQPPFGFATRRNHRSHHAWRRPCRNIFPYIDEVAGSVLAAIHRKPGGRQNRAGQPI